MVCTGKDFADSLSASAAGLPILLVDPDKKVLTDDQKAFLKSVKNDIIIIGGSGAVSETYEKALKSYDANGKVVRVKGSNRYGTSVAVAEMIYGNETPSAAVIAYAWNFPDGLCGGPLAYYMGAPLILTGPKLVSGKPIKSEAEATYEASIYVKNNDISGGIALGGTGALSDKTVRYAFRQSSSAMIKGERYQ